MTADPRYTPSADDTVVLEPVRNEKPFYVKFLIVFAVLVVITSIVWLLYSSLTSSDDTPGTPASNSTAGAPVMGPQFSGPVVSDEPSASPSVTPTPTPSESEADPEPTTTRTTATPKVTKTKPVRTQPNNGSDNNDASGPYAGSWSSSGNKVRLSINNSNNGTRFMLVGGTYAVLEQIRGSSINNDLMRFTFKPANTKFYVLDRNNNIDRTVSMAEFNRLTHKTYDDPYIDDTFFQVERTSGKLSMISPTGKTTKLSRS